MKRVRFNDLNEQREFFVKVKKKLGLGSKKLAAKLGLKSRGSIESYTFMRTAPPLSIVKQLEKISGINGNYEEIDGKVYRKKREFLPMEPKIAEEILRNKFGADFDYLITLIKSDYSIKEIIRKIRERKYVFDNSKISRCIGACRTNLLSGVVEKIAPLEKEVVVSAFVRKVKNTLAISFNLSPFYNILKHKKIRIGLELSQDRKRIRIFPLSFGRILRRSNGAITLLLTEKSGLKNKSNVEMVFDPEKFGFGLIDSIYDVDSRVLAKKALEEGFILDNYRSTPANHKGDLSLYKEDKRIIIEITQATSPKSSYRKIGQCFIQGSLWPDATHVLICRKEFLATDAIDALNKLKMNIVYTDFNKNWENEVIIRLNDLK